MALVRPTAAFVSHVEGFPVTFGPSDILEDDSPHVKAHPGYFEPVRPTYPVTVQLDGAEMAKNVRRPR